MIFSRKAGNLSYCLWHIVLLVLIFGLSIQPLAYGYGGVCVYVVPTMPSSITAPPSAGNNEPFIISWEVAAGDVTNYELYESTSSDFSNNTLIYSGTSQSHTISGRGPGTYYYRVRACNGADCGGYTIAPIAVQVAGADGDLNGDGMVDVVDVLLAERIALGLITPTANQQISGDVAPAGSPDGIINVADVLRIQRKALGLENF